MIEMSPFYAHESAVGPVFDVATWSRRKTWLMGISALVFGLLVASAMVFAWRPALLFDEPPDVIADIHEETLRLQKENPWAAYGGSAAVGFIGLFAFAAACASAIDAIQGRYYLRVGPGGISIRVPHGLDFSKLGLVFDKLELDVPAGLIADWTIVQHKQFGSMSRNTGNISAFFKIRMTDGKQVDFNLDCFREPSFVIHSKINDALQMVPARFGPEDAATGTTTDHVQTASGIEAKYDAILEALSAMLSREGQDSAVVVSDANAGKFVQFVVSGDSLVLDLPGQTLDEHEQNRAATYFGQGAPPAVSHLDQPSMQGFQVSAGSVEEAARLALEVFDQVYQRRPDAPLTVEHCRL